MDFQRIVRRAMNAWARDSELPLSLRLDKAQSYARSLALARWYLRGVTEVGRGVRVIDRPHIMNYGTIRIGHGSVFRSTIVQVELACEPGAVLSIGEKCSINYGVSIGATKYIELGNRVRVGPYSMIVDSQFHDPYDRDKRPESRPVIIEDDVWLGTRVSVMPGVRIGRGAIVGAHAVVTGDVAPFSVVAGVPARQISQIDPERFVVRDP